MALIRTLNTAVSGLKAHADRQDVIGDNLANSNTQGFKSTRVTFETIFSQTLERGTSPEGNFGGSNPKQVGMGTLVQEISKNFSQAPLKTTGRNTDVALEGDGFFIAKDKQGELGFTRDGSFGLNKNNTLTNPSTGHKIMGLNADENFNIPEGGPLEPIEVPVGEKSIAQQTSELELSGNFDASGDLAGSGAELHSVAQFVDSSGNAVGIDENLTDLHKSSPTGPVSLGLSEGDVIRISAKKGERKLPERKFLIGDTPSQDTDGYGETVDDLMDFLEGSLGIAQNRDNSPVNADGYSSNILENTVKSSHTFTRAQNLPGTRDEYDTNGDIDFVDAGVEVGDHFRILTGEASGQNIQVDEITGPNNGVLKFAGDGLSKDLALPDEDDKFAINNQARVALGTESNGDASTPLEDRNVQGGRVAVFSNAGKKNAISDLSFAKENGEVISAFNTEAEASGESVVLDGKIFDSRGEPRRVEVTYTKVGESNRGTKYRWIAESEDQTGEVEDADPRVSADGPSDSKSFVDDRVIGTGAVRFDQDGQYLGDNPEPNIEMKLDDEGTNSPLIASMNHEDMTALSNFSSEIEIKNQDGFKHGVLEDFAVGDDGTIEGMFDNGLVRPIAKFQVARFENNQGLNEDGANLFRPGSNSGDPIIGNPGEFGRGTIRGGALEESNVDVAEQFTRMIITQRGFQANTRAITTADEMLRDVVNLV